MLLNGLSSCCQGRVTDSILLQRNQTQAVVQHTTCCAIITRFIIWQTISNGFYERQQALLINELSNNSKGESSKSDIFITRWIDYFLINFSWTYWNHFIDKIISYSKRKQIAERKRKFHQKLRTDKRARTRLSEAQDENWLG